MEALANAFARSPAGWVLLTADGRLTDVNPALCRMLGRERDEVLGRDWWDFAAERDNAREARERAGLAEPRAEGFRRDQRFRRADGSTGIAHVVAAPVDGEPPMWSCVVEDVTAGRAAGDARLQAIVDNAPAVIYVKDPALRFVLVNRRWEALYGVRREDALGRTAQDVLEPSEAARLAALDEEVLRGGRAAETLAPVRRGGGGHVEHLTSQFPVFDDRGRVTGVCGIATDVTERRRSAGERAELERRLAQAQRLETVGRLAGGVAHDFNNLLSVILTCAGFALQEAEPDSALHEDVREIRRAAERGARLVRELLIVSRQEVVHPEVVDPAALLHGAERLLRRSLTDPVRLELVVDSDGAPPVLADPARLEQVLLNLVLNARDALGEDGGTVRVAVSRSPSGGARIAVSDDGPGMPPHVAERAFEPFFTTKPSGEGTGLGLATVRGIVADSGGTVEIDSASGRGTVVTVELPCTEAEAAEDAPTAVPEGGPRPGTILLAEDQGPVRRQARRILESAGYVVLEAEDGEAAMAALGDEIDLLLTDVVMPGMSGQELAERAQAEHPDMAVVVMSGHTEDAVLREGVREGGVGFVQKPFSEASLLQAVAVALAPEGIV